jgi:hypothetical protein
LGICPYNLLQRNPDTQQEMKEAEGSRRKKGTGLEGEFKL